MLTRLQVRGFKNLLAVDVRFGPFTCVLGANGVGKSNLFDAIRFLSALAKLSLAEAAASVRGADGRLGDVRGLFSHDGQRNADEMTFIAEMVVPASGQDELGAEAKATMTFLRYTVRLRPRAAGSALGPLELVEESLVHINKSDAKDALGFPHAPAWRDSVILGRRTVPYIETEGEGEQRLVWTRADSGGGGSPRKALAAAMPRTVLSTAAYAADHPTLVLARQEMMGWTQLQLEPTALRAPDPFHAPAQVGADGAHLPSALLAQARAAERAAPGGADDVYAALANRLAGLYEDVASLRVDVDERRELHTIVLTDLRGAEHRASALSDGTLRFLALAILEASPASLPLICLEEPENGIHPDRIEVILGLLQDIAVDVHRPTGPDNPMRQVIINTHAPAVAQRVPQDSLVIAEAEQRLRGAARTRALRLQGLPQTWRAPQGGAPLHPVLAYLQPPPQQRGGLWERLP
ncbi:MAG: AAA family ATPase [Deltaproteobacteria bacterium]|nr:AAA family ATPase [Deltaproteobacteria bacterium]